MTGYGRARKTLNGRDITVEVRSVNNRYLDCSVKMPRAYIFAEDAVKSLVQKNVSRGKVDVFVTVDSLGAEVTVFAVNEPLAKSYIAALKKLYDLGGGSWVKSSCYATDLARLPDVLAITKAEEDLDSLSADLCAVLEEALAAQRAGADYLGVGAVFATSTKLDAEAVSRQTLKDICAAVDIPVAAIGGIGKDNILELSGTGIDGVALVSAIFGAEDIEGRCRELRELARRAVGP